MQNKIHSLLFFLALLAAGCAAMGDTRPDLKTDLDTLRWGTWNQKKKVVLKAYRNKNPKKLLELLADTVANADKTRKKPDKFWYDNHKEQVKTLRFVINVLARIGKKEAFPAVLSIAALPKFRDKDGLARVLGKALDKLSSPGDVDALVEKASGTGIAPSHRGAMLATAARIIVREKKPLPAALSKQLDTMLTSKDAAVLKNALTLVGILKYKKAENILLSNLDSDNAVVKRESSLALVRLGNEKGVLPLLRMHQANSESLAKYSRICEKAGFADQVRAFHSRLEGKKFRQQTGYLQKAGAWK